MTVMAGCLGAGQVKKLNLKHCVRARFLLERARRFYVRARQVRTGLAQTASLGRWANCTNTIRAGMSGVVSRWLGAVEQLPDIALRLMRVQIENRPAVDCIKLFKCHV